MSKETRIERDTCTPMFIAALFIIARTRKQPRCPSADEWIRRLWSDQIRSVAQSCLTLCDPMNRSTPGLSVHHRLPEFTQTHVHWVSDAIQPSHPLSGTKRKGNWTPALQPWDSEGLQLRGPHLAWHFGVHRAGALASPLIVCITLSNSHYLSSLSFPICKMGIISTDQINSIVRIQ